MCKSQVYKRINACVSVRDSELLNPVFFFFFDVIIDLLRNALSALSCAFFCCDSLPPQVLLKQSKEGKRPRTATQTSLLGKI